MTQHHITYQLPSQFGDGRFQLREPIEGQHAIWLASDEALFGRIVVVRLLTDIFHPLADGAEQDKAIELARLRAELRHPVLPQVYAFVREGHHGLIVEEYVDGTTPPPGSATREELLRWGDALAELLAYLAGRLPPVSHGAICRANLRIDRSSGAIRLLGFRGSGSAAADAEALRQTLIELAQPEAHLQLPATDRGSAPLATARMLREQIAISAALTPVSRFQTPDGQEIATLPDLARWCTNNWASAASWLYGPLPQQIAQWWRQPVLAAELAAIVRQERNADFALDAALLRLDPYGYGSLVPYLQISPPTLRFHHWKVRPATQRVTIRNSSPAPARVQIAPPQWLSVDTAQFILLPGAVQKVSFSTNGWGLNPGNTRRGDALVKIDRAPTLRIVTQTTYIGVGRKHLVRTIAWLLMIVFVVNTALGLWSSFQPSSGRFYAGDQSQEQSASNMQWADDELREQRYLQGIAALDAKQYTKAREHLIAVFDYKDAENLFYETYRQEARNEHYHQSLLLDASINAVAYNNTGTRVFTWTDNGLVQCWNAATKDLYGSTVLQGDANSGTMGFHSQETLMALAGQQLSLIDAERCTVRTSVSFNGVDSAKPILNTSASHILFHSEQQNAVQQIGNTGSTLGPLEVIPLAGTYEDIVLNSDGNRVAAVNRDGLITVVDDTGLQQTMADSVRELAFNPSSEQLAVLTDNLLLFDETLEAVVVLFESAELRGPIVFSPDGRRIAAIDSDNNIRVWNTQNGALSMIVPASNPRSFTFSRDGRSLLIGDGQKLTFWDRQGSLSAVSEKRGTGTLGARSTSPRCKIGRARRAR
ncbi:hypothetical protein HC891_03695 [Candidatus Gracilibacteria bacterium]|nr:hypothetical protein [Candidatus Gracilibacteria bacterium]